MQARSTARFSEQWTERAAAGDKSEGRRSNAARATRSGTVAVSVISPTCPARSPSLTSSMSFAARYVACQAAATGTNAKPAPPAASYARTGRRATTDAPSRLVSQACRTSFTGRGSTSGASATGSFGLGRWLRPSGLQAMTSQRVSRGAPGHALPSAAPRDSNSGQSAADHASRSRSASSVVETRKIFARSLSAAISPGTSDSVSMSSSLSRPPGRAQQLIGGCS